MSEDAYKVLFLCTRNASRGILAEALLRAKGGERFLAYSAGTHPAGTLNNEAVALLDRLKIPTRGLRSKSWSEFTGPTAPHLNFIITLCDQAAGETVPEWPGHPVTALWTIPDPTRSDGSDIDRANAYRDVFAMLERRIALFISLPLASLDKLALDTQMRAIGTS